MRIPETTSMPRRPVYERYLRRKHHMPLDPPTEAEIADAEKILEEDDLWADDLVTEALRIIEERE